VSTLASSFRTSLCRKQTRASEHLQTIAYHLLHVLDPRINRLVRLSTSQSNCDRLAMASAIPLMTTVPNLPRFNLALGRNANSGLLILRAELGVTFFGDGQGATFGAAPPFSRPSLLFLRPAKRVPDVIPPLGQTTLPWDVDAMVIRLGT
jgi:hypothetical protein